jgi:small Trp-rich protein
MAFLLLGILLLVLKIADVGAVAGWSWLTVLAPFGLAAVWWGLSDMFGVTQRRAMRRMELKKEERRSRNLEALGLVPQRQARPHHRAKESSAVEVPRRAAKDPTTVD